MERKVIVEENFASQIDYVYNDLSDLNNGLYFLNRVSIHEDIEGLNEIDNYNCGRAFIIEILSEKLTITMKKLKKINTIKKEQEHE